MRAETYEVLSECYKPPSEEFARDVEKGGLYEFFSNAFRELELNIDLSGLLIGKEAFPVLKKEYSALFLGPLPPYVVPVESIYKKWSGETECRLTIATVEGYIMGDPAVDMLRKYRQAGIETPLEYAAAPDHISLELEYMALLCKLASSELQRDFLMQHLDWVEELRSEICTLSRSNFYKTVANATAAFVKQETERWKE